MSTGCRILVTQRECVPSLYILTASRSRAFLRRPQRVSCVPFPASQEHRTDPPGACPGAGVGTAWGGMLAFDTLVFALTLGRAVATRAHRRARRNLFSVILYDGARLVPPSFDFPRAHSGARARPSGTLYFACVCPLC